jgi:hypothetical protein
MQNPELIAFLAYILDVKKYHLLCSTHVHARCPSVCAKAGGDNAAGPGSKRAQVGGEKASRTIAAGASKQETEALCF